MSYIGKLAKGSLISSSGTNNTHLAVGTDTYVLTADSAQPLGIKWSPAVDTGIVTINGDTGSITGTTVTVFSNNATVNAGASVKFVNSSTTSTFNVTDASFNTLIGRGSGNLTMSGSSNTALGFNSLLSATSSNNSTAIGYQALKSFTSIDSANTAVGFNSCALLTSGHNNVAVGVSALSTLLTGENNIAIGPSSGVGYTAAESNNILLGGNGAGGDSGVIRIGLSGAQTTCFIQGIASVVTSNSQMVTIDTTTGKLGSTTISTGISTVTGQIFTATGAFTYTPTSGMKYVIVELLGGGGGGGGVDGNVGQTQGSGPGAGGGYLKFILTAAQVGASKTGSVGTAGAGGAAGNNNGTAGGNTTLATTSAWTAAGGNGGAGVTTAGVGTGGSGNTNTVGTGTLLVNNPGTWGGYPQTNFSFFLTGAGGNSIYGTTGKQVIIAASTAQAGPNATGFGAGGGGGITSLNATDVAGGNGSAGIAIFTEYV